MEGQMPSFRIGREKAASFATDVLAVPVFKGGEAGPGGAEIERKLGSTFKDLLDGARLKGDTGDALAVPTLGKLRAKQVLLVGLGEKGAGADAGRKAGAVVARRTGGAVKVATTVPQAVKAKAPDAVGAFVEGYLLAAYRFDRYKNGDGRTSKTKEVRLLAGRGWDARAVGRLLERANELADATSLARDLTNTPAGDFYP
ncbi:MAG: M17 family peptidase N-terminal domain-containing protein, partial [Actinomycetota bacterium]